MKANADYFVPLSLPFTVVPFFTLHVPRFWVLNAFIWTTQLKYLISGLASGQKSPSGGASHSCEENEITLYGTVPLPSLDSEHHTHSIQTMISPALNLLRLAFENI